MTTDSRDPTILTRPRILGGVLAGYDESCVSPGSDDARCTEIGIPVFEITMLEIKEGGPLQQVVFPAAAGFGLVWILVNR